MGEAGSGDRTVYESGWAESAGAGWDCDGNQLDGLEVCGVTCTADVVADGMCQDVAESVEELS